MKILHKRRGILPDAEVALLKELTRLTSLMEKYLAEQMKPKVFCRWCRQEVPDRKAFCARCEKQRNLDIRIQGRLLPRVQTIGGMALALRERR
jgi:hypothetical protein